jgi:hypothetical protein
VARDENGAALRGERPQEGAQPADARRIQPIRRLVEDQQLRVSEERRRKPEALAHPERVGPDASPGHPAELDQLEHLLDPAERQAGRERERSQVVATAAAGMEVARLQDGTDELDRLLQLAVAAAEDERLPSRRLGQAQQQPERRGLAGTVRAEVPGDRARVQGERDVVDGHDLVVALGE